MGKQQCIVDDVTGGNSHDFSDVTDSPLHSPNGRQMPAIWAVQGDCGIV